MACSLNNNLNDPDAPLRRCPAPMPRFPPRHPRVTFSRALAAGATPGIKCSRMSQALRAVHHFAAYANVFLFGGGGGEKVPHEILDGENLFRYDVFVPCTTSR